MTPRINHRNSALINSVVILPLEIPPPRVPMLMESLWITLEWLTIEMIACSNTTRLHGLARIRIYCRIGMNWDSRSWLSSTEIFSARTKAITGFSARPKAVSRPQVGCDITAFLDRTKAVSRPRKESFLQVLTKSWGWVVETLLLGVSGISNWPKLLKILWFWRFISMFS